MNMLIGKKVVLLCSATALAASLIASMETTSNAATASATARMQVVPSLISMTVSQPSSAKDKKPCENRFVSVYIGQDGDSAFRSQTSAQCTSVYEIPAQQGSLIIIP